ncbi:hypothetical protein QVD17_29509 [Tagetes erecta]|uniref:Ubiquitin-like protease family profile domain-containing protein n=1 Tax=Tagetes erecta TaxID=13708 RepID=A0AAD8KI21_TARER|nr:hypothetical protein QVD17_29509 [Tagetes erecta]
MAEVNDLNINKKWSKKNDRFELNWDVLLDDAPYDDIIISNRPSTPTPTHHHHLHHTNYNNNEYQTLTDVQLRNKISNFKDHIKSLGPKCKDNGDKLKATLRRLEAESSRRTNIIPAHKEQRIKQLSDQTDNNNNNNNNDDDDRKDTTTTTKQDQKAFASLKFAAIFSNKIDQLERTVGKETPFFNPRQGRKPSRLSKQLSSRSKQFKCPTTLYKISDTDKQLIRSATSPLRPFFTDRTPAPDHKDHTLTNLKPKAPSSYHLLDEDIDDIEDPYVSKNTTLCAEKLSDCMKDVQVYYPSRDDRDPVEVVYTDMECLAPEACLSSTIMNFYIRYLQQSSAENRTCNYHLFNTYFYNKLQKLNYRGDSFLKFRKWWKGINIFEKAYILFPVHQSAHWSLGIICIPTKVDELGPIVLHLDSLGLHNTSSIFDEIRRFLKEEWSYLRNSEVPLELYIQDEIWENLDHRITNRKVQVPQQRNAYDCGLFVLHYMERFIKEAPERLSEKDLSMFGKKWFLPEEASNLRVRMHNLLVQEFNNAKDKEAILSSKC